MNPARRIQLVDVFGDGPYRGNPLAVVEDSDGLSTDDMLAITRWLNLSETTFVLPPTQPGADYRVRIFTLDREYPFAGHPTLGTCHAWLASGGKPADPTRVIQECGAGLVPVRRDGERLAFRAPPLIRGGSVDPGFVDEVAAVLGIPRTAIVDAQWADNGPGWVAVLLGSAAEVLALEPAADTTRRWDIGVVGPHEPGAECAFELRAVFSDHTHQLREDPVTGSLNASIAQWLIRTGRARPPYVAAQGTRLGRRGRIHIDVDADGEVWVGGRSHTIIAGVQRHDPL